MICEICEKPKTVIENFTLKDMFPNTITFKKIGLFKCPCPIWMADEICYIREKSLEFSEEDTMILKGMMKQKYEFALKHRMYDIIDDRKNFDCFHKEFLNAVKLNPEAKDQKGNFMYSEDKKAMINEAKRINVNIWRILYKKK